MFSDNLSDRALQLLNKNSFSYETAAELCGMSPRHFGNIVRRHTVPSVTMLEKICLGFEVTPNELLLPEQMLPQVLGPIRVKMVMVIRSASGFTCYPICPGCSFTLERMCLNRCAACDRKPELTSGCAVLITPESA